VFEADRRCDLAVTARIKSAWKWFVFGYVEHKDDADAGDRMDQTERIYSGTMFNRL